MIKQRTSNLNFTMLYVNPRSLAKWAGAIIVVVIGIVLASVFFGGYFDSETVTTTVLDKERVCDSSTDSEGRSSTSCKYLVFTEAGTFAIEDAFIGTVRFNSSDLYGRVKRCHNYEITSYGWRLPLFSTYPNIKDMVDLGRRDGCES